MLLDQEEVATTIRALELRMEVYTLYTKYSDLGESKYTQELKLLDNALSKLIKSIMKYDMVSRINAGATLLVGEGNLSFTLSLVKKLQITSNLVTSTYESCKDLSDVGLINTSLLEQAGIKVLYDVDACKLHTQYSKKVFDTIVFQFPHSGSREPIDGLNPNYVLVRDFITSASHILKVKGVILITIVDSDFYNNMFRFEELSEQLNIPKPTKYKFNPKDYPEYMHTMTHQDESGIEDYNKFATWEFKI